MENPGYIGQKAPIWVKIEPFGPYLKYIGPILVSRGSLDSNLIVIKFIIWVYMANPGYIRQKLPM